MAAKKKTRDTTKPLDPCGKCGGVTCGTPRIVVCCGDCTH